MSAGNAFNAARRWAEAAKAYAAALELTPNRPGVLVQYGHALKEQGFLSEAEAAYLRAVRIEPSIADTHLQIGHVMKLQGDAARAVAAYEAAHRLDPNMMHGREELAQLRRSAPTMIVSENFHLHDRESSIPLKEHDDTADAILNEAKLNSAFLSLFDPFFYRMANTLSGTDRISPDLKSCLRHFCTVGIEKVLQFSPNMRFDAEFYCESYLGGMNFTPSRAYRHWLNTGLLQGAAPNRDVFAAQLLGERIPVLHSADLIRFAAQTDANAMRAPWRSLIERFAAEAADPDRTIAPDSGNVALYLAVAKRLERQPGDNAERAFRLRQIIAERVPENRDNRLQLAGQLRARGNLADAARAYRALEQEGRPSPMVFVGLAACEGALGFPEQALDTTVRGCLAFPDDQGMRWQRFDRAQRLFGHAWTSGLAAARVGRLSEGQADVGHACDMICRAYRGAFSGGTKGQAEPRLIRRILLASHAPLEQCRFYRVDQMAEQLEAMGFSVTVLDLSCDLQAFHSALHTLDAVVFCRVPALPIVVDAIEAATAYGLATFYDMDDLIFDPAFPDAIESYGGLLSTDDHAGLALAVPLFDRAMRMCTYGIASTQALAEAMQTRVASGLVYVRRNALGAEHVAVIEAQGDRPTSEPNRCVTIFYGSGGKAHKADFERLVEPALVSLVKAQGRKVSIVLMGEFPQTAGLRQIADNVTILAPIWDRAAYWSILAQADINLAMLLPGQAADAKSEIKWLEAAMFGIPTVASATATYRAVVRPDETGILCSTAEEWTVALNRLVRDGALRRRIGMQARAQALADYAGEVVAEGLRDFVSRVSAAEDTRPLVVVAHVFYPPQAVGGATRVVRDNVRDLLARASSSFRVELFSCLDGGNPYVITADEYDGVRVNRVGSPDHQDLERRPTDERMGTLFGDYLDVVQPAMVHFHCIQRLTASIVLETAKRGIPYVVTVHDGWWISDHQFLLDADGQVQTYDMASPADTLRVHGINSYLRMRPLRQALWGAKQILAVSEPFAEVYRACGVPNVISIENGVPSLVPAVREESADGKVWLGFIGGLARHKGYDLVQIAIKARPYRHLALLLIDHSLSEGIVHHEQWGTVAVEIRPKWPQDQVAKLYGRINVLLAPSVWPESFGLVTREAAASGCFVIASDRGSVGSFVRNGVDGFVIDASSPDGLIAALEQVDSEPQRFRRAVADTQTFRSTTAQADEIAAVYERVLAESAVVVETSK